MIHSRATATILRTIGLLAGACQLANAEESNETFSAAQFAHASSVSRIVAQTATRFAKGGSELASAVRQNQETVGKLARADSANG